ERRYPGSGRQVAVGGPAGSRVSDLVADGRTSGSQPRVGGEGALVGFHGWPVEAARDARLGTWHRHAPGYSLDRGFEAFLLGARRHPYVYSESAASGYDVRVCAADDRPGVDRRAERNILQVIERLNVARHRDDGVRAVLRLGTRVRLDALHLEVDDADAFSAENDLLTG